MSVNEDRTTTPAPAPVAPSPVADPAPLGLAGFALTTFLLSAFNAGWMTHASGLAWWSYALAYGGIAQLLAGMWEFRNRNVFGATAFGSYGAFWIGLFFYIQLVGAKLLAHPLTARLFDHDLGWILLAWAIFNTYMLMWSAATNMAVFSVFLTLEATEILLFAGFFAISPGWIKAGGYVGVLTALVAWYTSAAGVFNGMRGTTVVPVGGPLIKA